MKITKTTKDIVYKKLTVNYYLTIENDKGAKLNITYQVNTEYDPDFSIYETDTRFFNKDGDEIIDDYLNYFLGDDYEDFMDELAELTK